MTDSSVGKPWPGRTSTGRYLMPGYTTKPSQEGPGPSLGAAIVSRTTTQRPTVPRTPTAPLLDGFQIPPLGNHRPRHWLASHPANQPDTPPRRCVAVSMTGGAGRQDADTATPAAVATPPTPSQNARRGRSAMQGHGPDHPSGNCPGSLRGQHPLCLPGTDTTPRREVDQLLTVYH